MTRRRLRDVVDDRRGVIVALMVAGVFTTVSWLRYANYWAGALDLSIFDQGIWLMSRGHAPEVTVIGRSLFADHLSPVLVLFVPLYRLTATPLWLYAAQALCLGACPADACPGAPRGCGPVGGDYRSGAERHAGRGRHLRLPSDPPSRSPRSRGRCCSHDTASTRACTIAAVVVVLCRADLAWVLLGIAVVALPAPRRRLLILTPIALAAGVLIPASAGARGTWDVHYGHLGSSAFDAGLHPWRVVAALVSPDALLTLVFWLLPVALLPVLRPRWLLAVVVAGLPILVSRWVGTHLPYFHYGAPMAPIAIGGALHTLATRHELRGRGPALLVGGAVVALAVMSPLSPRAPDSLRLWRVVRPDPAAATSAAIAVVPADQPVSATPAGARPPRAPPGGMDLSRAVPPARARGPRARAFGGSADRVRTVVVDWSRRSPGQQLGFRVTHHRARPPLLGTALRPRRGQEAR